MSQVKFRNYTFKSNWSNSINFGAPRNRIKRIDFPGVSGILALNMKPAEREVVQTGTIRRPTQASLYDTIEDIESICDGAVGVKGAGGTSFSLIFHGTESLQSVFADGIEWGKMFRATGTGRISSATSAYYGLPFTIRYVELTP